ncbi:MAG: metallopeptidase TldD-related protein [Myxococcales bacterium]|nr:metallopeptidase TldD-related protein [Myxococcales bacterium]
MKDLRADGAAMTATLQGVLEQAARAGASAADAVMVESAAFAAGVRLGEIEKLTDSRERRLGLRVFAGASVAIAATADLSPAGLARFTADTVGLARVTAPDPLAGLPDPGALATDAPDLDLYDETAAAPAPDLALAKARAAERAALAVDPRLTNSEGAEFSQDASVIAYASTLGFAGSYRRSSFHLGVEPVASHDGRMQRDFWYARARHLARLDDPAAIGARAAERTLRRLGARRVKTQEAPVIFEAPVAVSLLGHLAAAVTGQSLYRGASFLLGRLGDAIAASCMTVIDDGRMLRGHGSRPFDAEGLPTRRTVVVERGVLASYLLDTYSAKRLSLASTGNAARAIGDAPGAAPTNFYLEAGPHALEALVASVERGLLVTELIGFGVNAVTGDYSRGAAGLWIEHGEIAYPVEEITIAGNLLDMFRDVEMIGSDLELRGAIAAPSLKVGRMTIAGA